MADFLTEIPDRIENSSRDELITESKMKTAPEALERQDAMWTLYTDEASSADGSGAGIILTSPLGDKSTYALRFDFKCSNNEAEYEALLAGMRLAHSMGVTKLEAKGDSLLVANQFNGLYEAKEIHIKKYLDKVKTLAAKFQVFRIMQVPRTKNKEADALSKLASVVFHHLTKKVLVEILPQRTIDEEIIETLSTQETVESWMSPFIRYFKQNSLPNDDKEARRIRINAPRYKMMGDELYRRGYSTPCLKCVTPIEAKTIIESTHVGTCGAHEGPKAIAQKILRTGYFWPTMTKDVITALKNATVVRYILTSQPSQE